MAANKFWGGDSSSSDSEDESSDSSGSSSSGSDNAPRRNFLDNISSSSEEEERVVKSQRTKVKDALADVVGKLKSAVGNNDWVNVLTQWDKLLLQNQKQRLPETLGRLPRSFVAALVRVIDAVKSTTKDDLKGVDGRATKAFNAMQQRVRKVAEYSADIANFRETPDLGSEDEESEPKEQETSDDDDGDDDGSEDDEESDDDDSDDDGKKKKKKKKGKKTKKAKAPAKIEWNYEQIEDRLNQYFGVNKPKKQLSSRQQLSELRFLRGKSTHYAQQFKILAAILALEFDRYNSIDAVMPDPIWNRLAGQVIGLLDMLAAHSDLSDGMILDATVGDRSTDDSSAGSQRVLAFAEKLGDSLLRSFQDTDPHSTKYLTLMRNESRFCTLCIRVQEYYESRSNYAALSRVVCRHVDLLYYKRDEFDTAPLPFPTSKSSRASSSPADDDEEDNDNDDDDKDNEDADAAAADDSTTTSTTVVAKAKDPVELPVSADTPSISDRLRDLCKIVYEHGTPVAKTVVLLMDVYHHALHDRYSLAHDMILMSHLQETIHTMDVNVQICFNRAMVQLGLAAFRQGLIEDAHACLMELYSTPRPTHKELLAQGLSKVRFPNEKPPERESLEKRRQIPYHKHISLEVVECVHLICALLLEVPSGAAHQYDVKHKSLSRSFSRLIEISEKQFWGVGPAESPRDHIIAAARRLTKGDWQSAAETLLQLSCWRHVRNPDALKAMLLRKVQEAALRTYIFSFAAYYDSMSVEKLSLLFQLAQADVHRLLSKMIIDGELHASHHQPTNSIVLHRVEPTRLHSLALQFAEKASALVEQSDKTSDSRSYSSYPYSSGFDAGRRQPSTNSKQRGGGQNFRGSSRGQDINRRGGRGTRGGSRRG